MVRETITGGGPMFSQVIRPLEVLAAQPYEALPEVEVRALVRNLNYLRNEILNVNTDTAPFWDAFLALSYQALYTYRHVFADKSDKVLETGMYDGARLFIDYWVLRLTIVGNSLASELTFMAVTEKVKLLEAVVNLTSPFSKTDISQLYQQLTSAKIPEELVPVEGTGRVAEEEKKEAKKLSSSVPSVPLVNVRNFISPLQQPQQLSLVDISEGSGGNAKTSSRFVEKYHKKIQRHLSDQLIGDKLLDILKDLPAFSALMEGDVGAINYFKAVITRPVDARAVVGKVDFLRVELDVAVYLSRLPLADCSSPSRLNTLCSFGISCVANACKVLTALNVVEAQTVLPGSENTKDNETDSVLEARIPTIAKAETLMVIYEQLEKSIGINHGQAARNMYVTAIRYFLSCLDGLLVATTNNDTPMPLFMPALFIVRQLLTFLSRLTDEIAKSEEAITGSVPLASELTLLDTYTPWYRFVYLMRHHDSLSILLKTLALCHTQSFTRLTSLHKIKDEKSLQSRTSQTKVATHGSSSSSSPPRGNKKMSLSQDDLILGCLWDELNAEPSATKVAESKKANVDAAFSEALLDTQLKLLAFLDRWFFDSENEFAEVCVKEFFQVKHLTLLLPMMTSASFEYVNVNEVEPVQTRSAVGTYVLNLDAFIHNLVTTRFVNDEIIVTFLKASGLDLSPAKKHEAWPLYIPRTFLSFFGRVLLKWQFEQQEDHVSAAPAERPPMSTLASSATTTIWSRFCLTIQQRVLKDDTVASSPFPTWWKDHMDFEDVNAEHVYLLLLTFHGLALMQKKAVVTQLASTFVSCACRTAKWTERSLLLVSRLLLILEYFMHKLYEPAEALLRQVDNLLFPSVPKQQKPPTDAALIPVYEMAQKVYDFSSPMGASSRRVFYYAIAPDLLHADPLTLDGLACSFLLAPNKLPEYADLYQGLSSLFNTLNITSGADTSSASQSVEDNLYTVATVNYTALLLWRLLRVLPPSLSHWEALRKDSQEFSLDSIHSITTSLWLTRLHNKSYKTWLKDTFVKLGLTPINADLLLSNCADASGLVRDVQRAKNFMEAFLAKNKKRVSEVTELAPVLPSLPAIDASPTEDRPSNSNVSEQSLREVSFYGAVENGEEMPTVLLSLSLVCLLCKMQQALDDATPVASSKPSEALMTFSSSSLTNYVTSSVSTAVPVLLDVIVRYGQFCTASILRRVKERLPDKSSVSFEVYRRLVFLCGPSSSGNSVLRSVNRVGESIPALLNEVMVEWDMKEAGNYPAFLSWKRSSETAVTASQKYSSDAAAYDSFVHSLVTAHMTGTCNLKVGNASYHNLSLKYTVNMLVSFLAHLQPHLPAGATEAGLPLAETFKRALLPIVMGGCFGMQDVETATTVLERILGGNTFEQEYLRTVACFAYDILKLIRVGIDTPEKPLTDVLGIDASLMSQRCIETLDAMMDSAAGRAALAQMFNEKGYDLTDILMSVTKLHLSPAYHNAVLNFVGHVLNDLLKHPDDKTMVRLGQSLSKIEQRSQAILGMWMDRILQSGSWKSNAANAITSKDPIAFLNSWVSFIQVADRSTSETLAEILLKALTATLSSKQKPSNEYPGLSELMPIMEVLASACKNGHEVLLTAAVSWLKQSIPELSSRKWSEELPEIGQGDQLLNNVNCLVWYIERILSALRKDEGKRTASPEADDLFGDLALVLDDRNEDEESLHAGEESDDNVDDSNRLCTFTITAKEFMSQHWYHCHTCGLTSGQGMCSVCAQVCHKGHDVTYSKYGSFFCDCGAREDGSCQALRKRSGFAASSSSMLMGKRQGAFSSTSLGSKSHAFLRPGQLEGGKGIKDLQEANMHLQEQLNDQRDALTKLLASLDVSGVLMALTDVLCKGEDEKGEAGGLMQTLCNSAAERSERVVQKLDDLHAMARSDVVVEPNECILQPLVATQERTFDNIKANLGEMSEMSVRSVAMQQSYVRRRVMAVFSHGATKYLAMVVEKSKVSVYQFSHLLKQVCDRHTVQGPTAQSDSHSSSSNANNTTKLTLPCHGSVTVSFAISSIVVNHLREGLFVLTGAKDCVAVVMNPDTNTNESIPVDVGPIDSSNFIVKAMWMADSQTELLIATLDFVKIFDLAKSVSKPVYNLLIANGKVRDVTLVYTPEGGPHVLIMSSTGQVFVQELTPVAAADMGPFFVTATLNLAHANLPRVASREEEAEAGGLAVYYSHTLQLLFVSYSQGRLFVAPLKSLAGDNTVFPASAVTFAKGLTQGLSLWNFSESGGQPGQVFAWSHGAIVPGLQGAVLPLVLALAHDKWTFQAIRNSNHKIKALDMVVTKHINNQAILASVNEDGTLKFCALNGEMASSWSTTGLSSAGCKVALQGTPPKLRESAANNDKNPDFPVDFFEECTVLSNVEYGGDLIDVYPKNKLKTRLDQNAMYIISERTAGFTIDVQNNDHTHVVCGVRIGVGAEGVEKIPAFVKVLGRTRNLATPRARYFDFPLTEEESLSIDGKVSLYFAPSDNGPVTYLDSLTVYGKSRASFGVDDSGEAEPSSNVQPSTANVVDMLLGRTLKALEMAVSIWSLVNAQLKSRIMQHVIDIISSAQTTLPLTTHSANFLLYALQDFQTSQFHSSKDAAVIRHAVELLTALLTKVQPDGSDRDVTDSYRFVQIISMLRPIAARRPASLYQHLMECVDEQQLEVKGGRATVLRKTLRGSGELGRSSQTKATVLLESLCNVFWCIHAAQPRKMAVATVVQLQELLPLEGTVHALVDIVHAIMSTDPEMIPLGVKLYSIFIGSKDQAVALAAKDAILKTLKPKDSRRYSTHQVPAVNAAQKMFSVKPEKSAENSQSQLVSLAGHGMPDLEGEEESDTEHEEAHQQHADQQEQLSNQNMEEMLGELQMVWQMVEPHLAGAQLNQFIENPANLQQILDIPPDADDEAMLDLAMALNMQPESDNGGQNENASVGVASSIQPQVGEESTGESSSEAENEGDGEGEDEGPSEDDDEMGEASSNAAADRRHSLLNEQPVRAPLSDEGSNGSSLAGDVSLPPGSTTEHGNANTSISSASQTDLTAAGQQADGTLRKLRHAVVEQLQSMVPSLSDGVSAIPTMQILFNLCTDLDPAKYEDDRALIDKVIHTVISSLNMDREDKQRLAQRRPENEVIILYLRFLSVLISKSASRYRRYRPQQPISSSFTNYCAAVLNNTKVLDFCHYLLKLLLDRSNSQTLKKAATKDETVTVKLLKPSSLSSPPDMAPFFLKPFVKSCGHALFQDYVTLLTEMALRLPYQMKKVGDGEHILPPPNFEPGWTNTLCEYMSFGPSYIDRRPPRKLLMALCGSKDKYRQVRDLHALECHIKEVRKLSRATGNDKAMTVSSADLDYDQLTVLVEHLKACLEIAVQRTINWQRHCQKERTTLPFLMRLATALDEPVATTVLHLLLALFGLKDKTATAVSLGLSVEDGPVVKAVVTVLNQTLEPALLRKFVRCFLLQANTTAMRLLSHHFLFAYYRNCDPKYQDSLIRTMWKLFEELPQYGYKAREFVDLLAYQTVKNPYLGESDWRAIITSVIDMLKGQNAVMNHHPNARIYQQLADITGLDGYFLESDPCLVCNCPDVPTQVMKLSSIKVDAKYTSNSQLYKLSGTFIIDRINLKITELKRAKMVKCITVYYSNVAVDNIVELKNNMAAWKKAKSVWLTLGQAEVKIDFLLPIQATNLMIEYSEYYDNPQMTQETLQCPRCSTMVPAQPGICGNCGENVFQCLKCRSINYEHREPWMCHSCGFCKYGKFDYTVQCRPSSSGNFDPVVNEEQRRRSIATVDGLLTKCDAQYRTLQLHRNTIETMLSALQKNEKDFQVTAKGEVTSAVVGNATIAVTMPASAVSNAANVNPAIQAIAYRYSVECKNVVQLMVQHVQKITTCRKLLRSYDESQQNVTAPSSPELPQSKPLSLGQTAKRVNVSARACYGCASAASQLCIRILRVISKVKHQHYFNGYSGLVNELIENHLHRGSSEQRSEVKKLVISLMQGSQSSVVEFVTLLQQRIASIQTFCTLNPSIATSVGNEIALLEMDGGEENDRHWEIKLRCVVRLFLNAVHSNVHGTLECIALPCLRIIVHSLEANAKGQRIESMSSLQVPERVSLPRVVRWLKGDARNSFQAWTSHCPKKLSPSKNSKEIHQNYLMQKYALRWRQKVQRKNHPSTSSHSDVSLNEESWLKRLIFYPGSQQVRSLAVELLDVLLSSPSRRYYVDQFVGALLGDGQALSAAGEYASEFVEVVKKETEGKDSSFVFVACPDILMKVSDLIRNEIEQLAVVENDERAENAVASNAQGYALKYLTSILGNLLMRSDVRAKYRRSLIGPVFNGYLSLRKLVMCRTKQVNEVEEKLLEIMESLTSGTEEETKSFMTICIEALNKTSDPNGRLSDCRTPQFIYERLCTIIFPQEKEKTEFSLVIEKDPQQEDYIQGRMQGNPYALSAFVPRLDGPGTGGPTTGAAGERDVIMRDIKNKICRDSELMGLLHDETAMELLVAGKIISLDLPVKSVYKKIWLRDNAEGSPIRVMYRLRGLMGDATEEFIGTLESRDKNNADPEEVYKLANVLLQSNGFPVIMGHLRELCTASLPEQAAPLIDVILRLLSFAVQLKINRQALIVHAGEWQTFSTFITLLKMTAQQRPTLAHQLLTIMEAAFKEASTILSTESYKDFVLNCGTQQDVADLLECLNSFEAESKTAEQLLHIIPFLCFGNEGKLQVIVEYFQHCLDFEQFDASAEEGSVSYDTKMLEWLCRLVEQLGQDEVAATFKDAWLQHDPPLTKKIIAYFLSCSTVITTGSPESAEFKRAVNRNSMKFVLRLLTGLARGHEATQVLLSQECVPSIHRLEHVSTPLSVLAENLMEVMKENGAVKERIEQIREQTKAEKKRLAMAMRAKQLGAMGMMSNEKGEIVITKTAISGMEELADDKGLRCCICREGYRFKPDKLLGLYTFTYKQTVEPLEHKTPKTLGFITVTHFTSVHNECHTGAIKSNRDEWEKAALHNANTRCNGIIPLWGPQVPESAYVQALARYNQHIQDFTGLREVNYATSIHDIKLSLLTGAEERSFSEVSRGGGRDSNFRLLPYTIHNTLYVMNSQRVSSKERANIQAFFKTRPSTFRAQCHQADSPAFYAVLFLLMHDRKQWLQDRLTILQRFLVMSHEKRAVNNGEVQEYSVYKSSFLFFALIDLCYSKLFAKVLPAQEPEGDWSETLAMYIRTNDIQIMEACDSMLQIFEEELIPATSAAEVMDILHLLDVITDPHAFIQSALTTAFSPASDSV